MAIFFGRDFGHPILFAWEMVSSESVLCFFAFGLDRWRSSFENETRQIALLQNLGGACV